MPRSGRQGSVVGQQYEQSLRQPKEGMEAPEDPASNEEIALAVHKSVAAAVELSRKYRHVAWYSAFVAAYMAVLYLQANAYKSGEVVATLKATFMPDGESTMTFQSESDVLAYLGQQVVLPIWTDPVCGNGICEWPWEFAAWGSYGCKADCGVNANTTQIVVGVRADFTKHPSIAARVLMSNAVWNLCLEDDARRKRGQADLCWYDHDQVFTDTLVNAIFTMTVIDGSWYVVVKGDYAGLVSGAVYDLANTTNPAKVPTTPAWSTCQPAATVSPTTTAMRRLLQAYTQAHQVGGEAGSKLMTDAIAEVQSMPKLRHVDFAKYRQLLQEGKPIEQRSGSAKADPLPTAEGLAP
ncbi:MAG: hypothetical protein WDW36_007214 [Sanguina aurantia]